MKEYKLAIVGATGLVGRSFIKILEERKHCLSEEERNGIDICRNIIANWR